MLLDLRPLLDDEELLDFVHVGEYPTRRPEPAPPSRQLPSTIVELAVSFRGTSRIGFTTTTDVALSTAATPTSVAGGSTTFATALSTHASPTTATFSSLVDVPAWFHFTSRRRQATPELDDELLLALLLED